MNSSNSMTNLAILASGSGTNAENIIIFFKDHPKINTALLVTNRSDAKAISRAKKHNVPVEVIPTKQWNNREIVLPVFDKYDIDFIALAGFLILVPSWLIEKYQEKIVNIHPALLPDFGGKGMYGRKVHEAVINEGREKSGITIHYVNEKYDKGAIIFQACCKVPEDRSPDSLAEEVHKLEYEFYPKVIESLITGSSINQAAY